MGGSESTLGGVEGYQVARVLVNSPAHRAGLLPYFDVIVAVDGIALDREHKTQFQQYVTKSLHKEITLAVFNLRCRSVRDVLVSPSDAWGGVGVLGCSLNWDTADRMVENTWHLVDVAAGSPAAAADLVPGRDYLLGMQTPEDETITMFSDADDFQDRLARWKALRASGTPGLATSLLLLVFDSVNNAIKEECVTMGAQLSLGVDVANGYLHVIAPTLGSSALPVVKKFYVGAAPPPAEPQSSRAPAIPEHAAAVAAPEPAAAAPVPAFPSPPATAAAPVAAAPVAAAPAVAASAVPHAPHPAPVATPPPAASGVAAHPPYAVPGFAPFPAAGAAVPGLPSHAAGGVPAAPAPLPFPGFPAFPQFPTPGPLPHAQ